MLKLKIFKKSRIIFWKYCEDSLILRAKPIEISLKLVINLLKIVTSQEFRLGIKKSEIIENKHHKMYYDQN